MSSREAGVLALFEAFGQALRARDLEASMDLLELDDPNLAIIPSDGVEPFRGVSAVRGLIERVYSLPNRYSWRWEKQCVTVVGEAAWFIATGDEMIDEGSPNERAIPYCMTGAASFDGSRWRLRLLHGSEDAGGDA